MPKNSGHPKRDLFPATGAGKGDVDRSPGWREHYDEINWTPRQSTASKRFRKVYGEDSGPEASGPATPRPDDAQSWRTNENPVCTGIDPACPNCSGLGHTTVAPPGLVTCPICGGTGGEGDALCRTCNANGWIDAPPDAYKASHDGPPYGEDACGFNLPQQS